MSWTNRDFDPVLVSSAVVEAVRETFSQGSPLPQSQDPEIKDSEIVEYNARMRAAGLDKMGTTCYVSVVNFYLNQPDLERHKAKGAMVLYVEMENAAKIFSILGLSYSSDEDDASMIQACGQMISRIAEQFNRILAGKGYSSLVLSKPQGFRNNVVGGVEYSFDQKTKHEISFFYGKSRAVIIEVTLAPIPKK